jgi:hypothetical protein
MPADINEQGFSYGSPATFFLGNLLSCTTEIHVQFILALYVMCQPNRGHGSVGYSSWPGTVAC